MYEVNKWYEHKYNQQLAADENEQEKENKPRFDGRELGKDPSKSPGEGFEWRGRDAPGGTRGNWYNPETGETLHPDLNHPPPIDPHWDYTEPSTREGYRLFIDGTWELK